MVHKELVGESDANPIPVLHRPRPPIERQAAETPPLLELAIKAPDAVRDRVGVNDGIVADQADVAALRAFEAEIHEIAPAALAPARLADHLAIVLNDGDDVALGDQ